MADPYSTEHEVIAEQIIGEAYERLVAAGLDRLEAAHLTIRTGIDRIAPGVNNCAGCTAREYDYVAEALEGLIEDAEAIAGGAEHVGAVH